MSFIPDKSEIFSEISSIKALQDGLPELNKLFNSFDSVKSKSGDLIPLMLDLLKTLLGDQIKETFKELLKETDKIESKIKKTIIKTTLKQVSKKTDFKLSQIQNPILNINIKNIDIEGTLKVDPNTDLGKFYYGKAAPLANVPNDPSIQVAVEPGGVVGVRVGVAVLVGVMVGVLVGVAVEPGGVVGVRVGVFCVRVNANKVHAFVSGPVAFGVAGEVGVMGSCLN